MLGVRVAAILEIVCVWCALARGGRVVFLVLILFFFVMLGPFGCGVDFPSWDFGKTCVRYSVLFIMWGGCLCVCCFVVWFCVCVCKCVMWLW